MRLIFIIYDRIRYLLTGEKAFTKKFLRLYRPDQIVNVEVGMMVEAVNRYEGSICFDYAGYEKENKGPTKLKAYDSPARRKS